ncbi:MAG: hypothetical protein EOP07_04320 [Proteobacteria bacterium]|nr:MAG: hypothetical protein EOP07_04320 [Pseudomonadota bacterium]
MSRRSLAITCFAAALISTQASAIFVDGHGYYGVRGEARTKPENIPASSASQTIDQFFRLDTELRVNDKASAIIEFKIFDDERESYMGDRTAPQPCPSSGGTTDPNCTMPAQNSIEPHYSPLQPKITKAYVQYSMDYCLLTIGRRGRQWGMGLFLDDGTKPFATDASVFDGVTCDINIQKSQTLGFSVGYDKISETGSSILYSGAPTRSYGGTDNGDDLDQLFLTIEYNDHRANAGKGFSKQIGIYFANIIGGENTKTDIKLADLYVNFLMNNFVWQNEVYFRLGKSADPSFALLGGVRTRTEEEGRVENDVQSIALAGSLDYYLSRSGAYTGPKEYNQGNATSQSLFFNYAYAPGDKDGYRPEYPSDPGLPTQRDKKASAVAFHKNFKPALLLFNGRKNNDNRRIDGIYDPYRVMNATVYSLGYRYESLESGNFEVKAVTAELNEAMPKDLTLLDAKQVGSYGTNLGVELDFMYSKKLGKEFEFGAAAAIGVPGDAQRTRTDEEAVNNYMLQSYAAFHF